MISSCSTHYDVRSWVMASSILRAQCNGYAWTVSYHMMCHVDTNSYCEDNLIGLTAFRHMSGREGRAGLDDLGEAILLGTGRPDVDAHVRNLLQVSPSTLDPLSPLYIEGKGDI